MTLTTDRFVSLLGLDPATYRPHAVHRGGQVYHETNCYTDIVIELIHATGAEPLAILGSTVRLDFEGDQWTFFKPYPADLERLAGIDIHEMQPYRPIPETIAGLIGAGRTMTIELDAWYLPDTAATSYGTEHVKTSVIAEGIDLAGQRLRYFHNAGFYELAGDDYRGVFRLEGTFPADTLPPYTELVRFDAGPPPSDPELRAAAGEILAWHLDRVLPGNPFERFGRQLLLDLPDLLAGDEATYHAYAFATVRMAGAGFELCAAHIVWLYGAAGAEASAALTEIVEGCKVLGFKLARRRPFDPEPGLEAMAAAWSRAIDAIVAIRAATH
jgi:hypothetical protein